MLCYRLTCCIYISTGWYNSAKQGTYRCLLCCCVCPIIRPSLKGSHFMLLSYCILLQDPPNCHLIFTFLYLQHPILLRLWHLHCSFILFFVCLLPDARCAVGCRQKQYYPRTCYNSQCSCVLQPAKFTCASTALLRTTSCPPSPPHFIPCESSALCASPAASGATWTSKTWPPSWSTMVPTRWDPSNSRSRILNFPPDL